MAPLQDGPVLIPLERELEERLAWFIGMRWLAGAGILLGTFLTSHWLLQALPVGARPGERLAQYIPIPPDLFTFTNN